jgi:hypothetical protein
MSDPEFLGLGLFSVFIKKRWKIFFDRFFDVEAV